jgi:poly-gamma-glutamate synthesis protein (capsule biosynthesis protein)
MAGTGATLALTGDVMLGRLVDTAIKLRGFAYPWGNTLPLLHRADRLLINLECALTAHTEPWRGDPYKPFFFRADPAAVATLSLARVSFASLANNHSLDFDVPGMLETIAVLDRAGITHAGAGRTLAEARAPAWLTADGLRIAVLAFADHPLAWAATPHSPGINYTPVSLDDDDFAPVAEAIAAVRAQADLVVFSIHWGPNMRARPAPHFRSFARRVIEAGVDIFWGHSAHVVQGIEFHQGKPILYDTGDFVDDYAVDPDLRNDLSALFLLRAAPRQVLELALVPVQIGEMQVNLAQGREREWFLRRLGELCAEFGTTLTPSGDGLSVRVVPAVTPEGAR